MLQRRTAAAEAVGILVAIEPISGGGGEDGAYGTRKMKMLL